VGSFIDARRDVLGLIEGGVRRYGPTVRFKMGPFRLVIVNRPEDVRHVLVTNRDNYRKSPSYQVLKAVLGNGLITSEGDFWRRQRKLAQPAFHHQSLASFADTMGQMAADLAADWTRAPGVRDIHAEMMHVTLRVVGHTLMSTELGEDAGDISEALDAVLKLANELETFLFLPEWVPTPGKRRAARAIEVLDQIVYRLIRERRESGEPGTDLLGMLMAATDGDESMTDLQLRDELMTLILAGHETTANALTWTLLLLSRHPEVHERLRSELDEVLGVRLPGLADVKRLTYTEQVIKEAMRVYPPVWMVERQAVGDDELGVYHLPAGHLVGVSPWTLHRDPEVFPEPARFDPDRFTPEASAGRSRYSYLPFGGGQRTCIGNAFAMMEAVIILATLVSRFDIRLVDKRKIELEPSITLRPKRGLRMSVSPRR
jgi:cytochrome P450